MLLPVSHMDSVCTSSEQTDPILFFRKDLYCRFVFYGREGDIGILLIILPHSSDHKQGVSVEAE